MKEYGLVIDGKEKHSGSGLYSDDINPANGEINAKINKGTIQDVDMAVKSCAKAFETWKNSNLGYRADILNKMADIMESRKEHFAKMETLSTGKCFGEAMLQMGICVDQYRYFAGCLYASEDSLVHHNDGSFSMIVREPLGTVAIILPWNAPTMLMSWKLAPALAAGNCVIVKPASNAALPILELVMAFQEVLPPGVLNVVTGRGGKIGNHIAAHEGIAKISFTGSTEVGISVEIWLQSVLGIARWSLAASRLVLFS